MSLSKNKKIKEFKFFTKLNNGYFIPKPSLWPFLLAMSLFGLVIISLLLLHYIITLYTIIIPVATYNVNYLV
jgi:hypothetical protein